MIDVGHILISIARSFATSPEEYCNHHQTHQTPISTSFPNLVTNMAPSGLKLIHPKRAIRYDLKQFICGEERGRWTKPSCIRPSQKIFRCDQHRNLTRWSQYGRFVSTNGACDRSRSCGHLRCMEHNIVLAPPPWFTDVQPDILVLTPKWKVLCSNWRIQKSPLVLLAVALPQMLLSIVFISIKRKREMCCLDRIDPCNKFKIKHLYTPMKTRMIQGFRKI